MVWIWSINLYAPRAVRGCWRQSSGTCDRLARSLNVSPVMPYAKAHAGQESNWSDSSDRG